MAEPFGTGTGTRISIRPKQFAPEPIAPAASAPSPAVREWSPLQHDIFDFVRSGQGSAVVIAVAGSGKTSTIVEAAKFLPTDSRFSCAFVAFNKSIADELRTRLPASVRAQTLNSLGFGAWRRHIGDASAATIRLDTNKTRSIFAQVVPDQHFQLLSKGMPRLIGLAKAAGLVPHTLDNDAHARYNGLLDDSDDVWLDMIERHSIDFEANIDRPEEAALITTYARKILVKSIECASSLIDFDDQLYMPVITGASFWQNDLVFVDEAQDLNRIQRVMIRRALKPRGRLIAVGDPNQAIYAFRGADSGSISSIKHEFNARELPLTISYRCPKAVVMEARQWVSHIQSHESAKAGTVNRLKKFDASLFLPTDAIVCRNTRPLIALAFLLLRDDVPCKVKGRDIGAGLVALVKRFKEADLDLFQQKLDAYVAKKVAELVARMKDDVAQRLQDQYDTLAIFIDALDPGATTAHLVSKIEGMFTDNGPNVLLLSTIHKAKGLEWDRVFILDPELMPSRFARTPEAKQQEANLQYVAATRAKSDLYYINSKGFVAGKEGRGRDKGGKR